MESSHGFQQGSDNIYAFCVLRVSRICMREFNPHRRNMSPRFVRAQRRFCQQYQLHGVPPGNLFDYNGHKQFVVLHPLCSREIFQRQRHEKLVILHCLRGGYILEWEGGHEFVQLHTVQLRILRQPGRSRQLHPMRLRAIRDNLRGHCMHCLCSWDVPVRLGQRPPAFFSAGSAWLPGLDR